jgi:hypothetical protein
MPIQEKTLNMYEKQRRNGWLFSDLIPTFLAITGTRIRIRL